MKPSRIQAVDHVNMEAPLGVEDGLRWFYGEVVGLEEIPPARGTEPVLCFRSGNLELRIRLLPRPNVDPMDGRLTLMVQFLSEAKRLLDERHVSYEPLHGLDWTDRRVSLLDPGGNRVELKQQWPEV